MRPVPDAFLLNMAEVSAALVGLFQVGMLFFVETGFRRVDGSDRPVERYFRSSARIVMILYAIPILLSLTLVALEPIWSTVLFVALIVLLVAANVDTARRARAAVRATGSTALGVNEVVGSLAVLAIALVPWLLGGVTPTREDLTWSILLAFGAGFLSVCATVLAAFDISSGGDRSAGGGGAGSKASSGLDQRGEPGRGE